MCFDGTPRNVQLLADFFVIATLKQKLGNLLLTRSQPDKLVLHAISPIRSNANESIATPARQAIFVIKAGHRRPLWRVSQLAKELLILVVLQKSIAS